MAELNPLIVGSIAGAVVIFIIFIIFYAARYNKFKTNEYVIHFRRGKVKRAGTGGTAWKMPLFDDIIVIPTTVQQTLLEANEQVVSHEYQDVSVTAYVYWRVNDPKIAYEKVSWVRDDTDYIEKTLKNATEAIIRTTCANMAIENIIRERAALIKEITGDLHDLVGDWGIVIESVEVRDVEVVDKQLKANLEAQKKLAEAERAQVREAQKDEIVKMRQLDVEKKTGLEDQKVKQTVELASKERQIAVAQQEQERAIVEAETDRKQRSIEAEADKAVKVASEIQVQVERELQLATARKEALVMEGEGRSEQERLMELGKAKGKAEATKLQLLAEAEGIREKMLAEAEGIKAKLLAEAEGVQAKADALKEQGQEIIELEMIKALPEIAKNINIDKAIVMGESGEQVFGDIARMAIPLMALKDEFVDLLKDEKDRKPRKRPSSDE